MEDDFLDILERGIETFHINPLGGNNIIVEGSDRFAHERDVKALSEAAKHAAGRIRELERRLNEKGCNSY